MYMPLVKYISIYSIMYNEQMAVCLSIIVYYYGTKAE